MPCFVKRPKTSQEKQKEVVSDGPPSKAARIAQRHEALLCCQICMQKFNRNLNMPLCLKCGHTVCKACAKGLFNQARPKCPFDNSILDGRSADNLPKNFTLLDLIDAEKQSVTLQADERYCDVHPEKKVKFYCQDHSAFSCSECLLTLHLGHKIIPARDLILGESVQASLAATQDYLLDL